MGVWKMEKGGKCPECGGEVAEWSLCIMSGTWGRPGHVKAKATLGLFCTKCGYLEIPGHPPPKGKRYILRVRKS